LTPEFVNVLGKKKSPNFQRFEKLCCNAYNILRKHAHLFISLFSLMLSTGIPVLRTHEDIDYLKNAFSLGKSEEEAAQFFTALIEESLNTKATTFNFLVHNIAHPT
jgi:phosphatidylinositol kinase/protein kinase (PI-3  family)